MSASDTKKTNPRENFLRVGKNYVLIAIGLAVAAALYALAAEQGHLTAMFAEGDCYYEGKGREKDWKAAAEWYQKALDAGYQPDETDKAHMKDVLGE